MEGTVIKKEYIGEQDGFICHRIYTPDGGVSISRHPILSEDVYNRRKQEFIEVASEMECRRMVREQQEAV